MKIQAHFDNKFEISDQKVEYEIVNPSFISKVWKKTKNLVPSPSIISGIWSKAKETFVFAYSKGGSYAARKTVRFLRATAVKHDFRNARNQSYSKINETCGSEVLSEFLVDILPDVTNFFRKPIVEFTSKLRSPFASIFRYEDKFIENYIETLIIKGIANFCVEIDRLKNLNVIGESHNHNFLVLSIQIFFSLIGNCFEALESGGAESEAFSSSVEKLLNVVFPRGKEDFCLSKGYIYSKFIAPKLWHRVKNKWFPDLLINCYKYCCKPKYQTKSEQEIVFRMNNGLVEKSIFIFSNEFVNLIPLVIKVHENSIVKLLSDFFESSKFNKFEPLINQSCFFFIQNLDVISPKFWDILKKHIYSFIIQCIGHSAISFSEKGNDENNYLLNSLCYSIEYCKNFFSEREGDPDFREIACMLCQFILFDEILLNHFRFLEETIIPNFLEELYNSIHIPASNIQEYMDQLMHFFYDSSSILSHIVNHLPEHLVELFQKVTHDNLKNLNHRIALWEVSGAKKYAIGIQNLIQTLTSDILIRLANHISENADMFAYAINNSLKGIKFDEESLKELLFVVKQVIESQSDAVECSFKWIENQIGVFLFKTVSCVLHNSINEEVSVQEKEIVLAKLVSQFLQIIKKNMVHLKNIEINEKDISGALVPFSKELCDFFFPLLEKELPLPKFIAGYIGSFIQDRIIPLLFAPFVYQVMRIIDEKEKNRKLLLNSFNTTYPSETCKVIRFFVEQFLPYFFYRYDDSVVDSLYEYIIQFFNERSLSPHKNNIVEFLDSNYEQIKKISKLNFVSFLNDEKESELHNELWSGIAVIVEAYSLSIFAQAGEKMTILDKLERENPLDDFLLNVCIDILKITTEHFLTLNKIKKSKRKSDAYKLSYKDIVAGFGYHLHPAISSSDSLNEESKDLLKLNHFFKKFIEKLSAFIQDPLFESSWKWMINPLKNILKSELLPRISLEIFKKSIEAHSLNLILINSLELFNDSTADTFLNCEGNNCCDEQQKILNQTCGEFVLELIKLFPKTFTKSIFKFDRVKKMTAEKIGRSIREKLSKISLKELANKFMFSGLPALHFGAFEGEPRMEIFIPKKRSAELNSSSLSESSSFDFNFPRSKREIDIYEWEKRNQKRKTQKKLKKEMVETITTEIEHAILEFFHSNWAKFQTFTDKIFNKLLGSCGAKVKSFLDLLFNFIFLKVVLGFLKIVTFPLYKLGLCFLRNHTLNKSKKIIKDYHMSIHENCLYKIIDLICEACRRTLIITKI